MAGEHRSPTSAGCAAATLGSIHLSLTGHASGMPSKEIRYGARYNEVVILKAQTALRPSVPLRGVETTRATTYSTRKGLWWETGGVESAEAINVVETVLRRARPAGSR